MFCPDLFELSLMICTCRRTIANPRPLQSLHIYIRVQTDQSTAAAAFTDLTESLSSDHSALAIGPAKPQQRSIL